MLSNYLKLPSCRDIRAARNYIGWSQKKLGEIVGSTEYTINSLENSRHESSRDLVEKIVKLFWNEGIHFLPGGGFKDSKNIVDIYEGDDCYLRLQDDILNTCVAEKCEVLYLGADDSKSSEKIIEKEKELKKLGVPCKNLIEIGNDFITGDKEDYRQVDNNYFLSGNVVVIYGNKVAFPSIINKKGISTKTVVINDEGIVQQLKKYFYFLWKNGKKLGSK